MMDTLNLKTSIEAALRACADRPLAPAATELFDVLGYRSEKRLSLTPNTPDNFLSTFAKDLPFNPDQALLSEWRSVDFLFQLTDEEVRAVALGDRGQRKVRIPIHYRGNLWGLRPDGAGFGIHSDEYRATSN